MQKIIFFLFGMILFSSGSTFCQTDTNYSPGTKRQLINGEVYALVVGISDYHYIKPLSYADKDAELFADLLRSAAGGNIKEENLFLLKNDSANAGNFWSALSRIINKQLKKDDRVYIYFAGHGDGVKGLNEYYLLLSDCQPANDGNNYLVSFSAIDMYKLKNRIGLLTAKGVEVVLVLDACRTNELAGGYASQVFNSSIIQTKVGEIAMLATGPGEVSIEDASFARGHGLFTYNLIDAISGYADKEDGNNDNIISLEEINRWVSKKVKLMSGKFNVKQVPVFCCDEKNNTAVGIVDSSFSVAWNQLKNFSNSNDANVINPVKAQRNSDLTADSNLLFLYNKFNTARKENRLWGDSSADRYYDMMTSRYNTERITEDARYALAAEFINFAQQKINLYLEGKDQLSVGRLREKNDSVQTPGFLSDEYERLEKMVSEKWTITARMVQKAGKLLSTKNDSTLLYQLKPRIGFLLARGYISQEKESSLRYADALQYALEAYKADSTAAYTAECLALVLAYRHSLNPSLGFNENEYEMGLRVKFSDTAMNYFRKAIHLAPKWVSPYRSIALKIYGESRRDEALAYLHKALLLNPQDGTTHVMIGDLYRQMEPDSALYYFKKALALSGKSSYSTIYRKMARSFLGSFTRNSPSFKPDSVMAYSRLALAADPGIANDPFKRAEVFKSVYMDIAQAFVLMEKPADALPYYLKIIDMFPKHDWANRSIIRYYNSHNHKDSVLYYSKKYLQASPGNAHALLEIARYYDNKKGLSDSAILYYKRNLSVTKEKDMARERLGYLLMNKDKNDPAPLTYFTETLQETPFAWRSYYNIACYYANIQNLDKSIEFLQKALEKGMKDKNKIYADSLLAVIRDTETFKKLIAKYFPG